MSQPSQQDEMTPKHGEEYQYQHAGIRERAGRIPLWLLLVLAGLLIWSVYYTIRFWSSP
jgi:hypothetical protein